MVYYEHQVPEEPFWVAKDSIELALSSQPAPDVRHILPIIVSYYAAHSNVSSQLWKNKGKGLIALVACDLNSPVGSGAASLDFYAAIDVASVSVMVIYHRVLGGLHIWPFLLFLLRS